MTIKNTSFERESSGPIRIDNNGDIVSYFHLMDFNSLQNKFVSVLEILYLGDKKVTLYETNASIIWPNSQILSPDICDFTLCESGGEYFKKNTVNPVFYGYWWPLSLHGQYSQYNLLYLMFITPVL